MSGAAILGIGVWFLADKNVSSYFTVVQLDTDDLYFKLSSYILIGFGGFVFLVGFCGCCGAIRGSKCLLGFVSITFWKTHFIHPIFSSPCTGKIWFEVVSSSFEFTQFQYTLYILYKNVYSPLLWFCPLSTGWNEQN